MFQIHQQIFQKIIVLFLLTVLMGCTNKLSVQPLSSELQRCQNIYQSLDQAVAETIISPSWPAKINGFPYLRVDRFLSSYTRQDLTESELSAWLQQMVRYDLDLRAVELAGLDNKKHPWLAQFSPEQTPLQMLNVCSEKLKEYDLHHPERLAELRRNAQVPSEYSIFNRIFGIYPLVSIPASLGVENYHQQTRQTFAQPLPSLPVRGELQRFVSVAKPSPVTSAIAHDALFIPQPTPLQLENLFARHAPVWEIDVVADYDLPGIPVWQSNTQPTADTAQPIVYHYPSYTRWQGQALLQLNYLIWFSERPAQSRFDILAGRLDGLIWRVTLNTDGSVLIYDTIHPCGCYHYFFPGTGLALRNESDKLPEPPLVVQNAPDLTPHQSIVIRVESGTHYIQRVYADNLQENALKDVNYYHLRDYRDLYASTVMNSGKTLSLFDKSGLVRGTERAERWLLWPLGVPSAGAMRERGRHAVAFVGQRHFDDADLLEQLFFDTTD